MNSAAKLSVNSVIEVVNVKKRMIQRQIETSGKRKNLAKIVGIHRKNNKLEDESGGIY